MSEQCSNCIVTEQGYTVLFQEEMSFEALDLYLKKQPATHWRKIDSSLHWMKEPLFHEILDYATAHLDTDRIKAVPADREDPLRSLEHLRPIAEFQAQREAHWIDEVIRQTAIRTYYQPIVALEGEAVRTVGYELLSRGVDADGGLIPPNRLFEAARVRNRLFALDRVCRLEAVKNAAGLDGQMIFINFLPTTIYNPEHCLQSTFAMVQKYGIDPSSIIFEVVESEEIRNMDHLRRILQYYKDHGFRFALDDVGTGYNSLEVLAELKPDVVKLAIEYTRGVSRDAEKRRIAEAVVRMTHTMGSQALAEGVEDAEDLACLREMGYDLFQGYYFGKPGPVPVLAEVQIK
ncbi:diguanylate cyclase [Paenibacillus swuensis]|uniref:Diguanylate cyclase n=1 Tax=Paenibacillus swuensis TaxID=1178515 RepID=A0A172TI11_9BACL|nr:EAL domain-containing protein [Paenibacillus swuensis]ANE46602.1 diguanylate cyclase [Paenibacillus swuensis]